MFKICLGVNGFVFRVVVKIWTCFKCIKRKPTVGPIFGKRIFPGNLGGWWSISKRWVDKDIFGDDQDGTIAIYAQGFLKNKFPCGTPWSIPPIWTAACDSVSYRMIPKAQREGVPVSSRVWKQLPKKFVNKALLRDIKKGWIPGPLHYAVALITHALSSLAVQLRQLVFWTRSPSTEAVVEES